MSDHLQSAVSPGRPPLRISQTLSACSFCRSRKIKCDGIPPTCGGCIRFGHSATCSLSAGGARPARDYPTYLRAHIHQLQHSLERARESDASRETQQGEHDLSFRPTGQSIYETPSSVDTLIADIGAVPILASSYSQTGDGPTLSNILLGAASKDPLSPLAFAENDTPSSNRLTSANALPRKNIALRFVQHYIDHVYPRLPFFSIQGFWAQFDSVYSTEHDSDDRNLSASVQQSQGRTQPRPHLRSQDIDQGHSIFTVLLVLAIASSSLSRSADSVISSQAQRLFNAALEYRESPVRLNTIAGVQSLLFLIQYATLNPSVLDAWYLIEVGMRSCIDLGLHQEPQQVDSISPSLLETRRRLWWSMYSFDRSVSIGCGRPAGISDSVIRVRLPSFRIESMATEEQIQGYLQRYRALQIQSHIYNLLNTRPEMSHITPGEAISDLSRQLGAWRSDNGPAQSQTLVESEWLMGKILLNRPCKLIPQRTCTELHELWAASLRFSALYRQLVESNGIFYVQIASEKLYWVGIAILYSFWELKATNTSNLEQRPAPVQFQLWIAVQDILFSIRTLSERWEDGRILARQFEAASMRVISLTEDPHASPSDTRLPDEVEDFANYISLTSIRAAQQHHGPPHWDSELLQLASDMLKT